jgi:hypothetical protein
LEQVVHLIQLQVEKVGTETVLYSVQLLQLAVVVEQMPPKIRQLEIMVHLVALGVAVLMVLEQHLVVALEHLAKVMLVAEK